jgi:hypothetical protein
VHARLPLTADSRLAVLSHSLRAAVVRMPDRKAKWLAANFARIQADGGPGAFKRNLEGQPGRQGKID